MLPEQIFIFKEGEGAANENQEDQQQPAEPLVRKFNDMTESTLLARNERWK